MEKVISSLTDLGSESLALLRKLAERGVKPAVSALRDLGETVKNATDGEFDIAGRRLDLNPFW